MQDEKLNSAKLIESQNTAAEKREMEHRNILERNADRARDDAAAKRKYDASEREKSRCFISIVLYVSVYVRRCVYARTDCIRTQKFYDVRGSKEPRGECEKP